MARAAYEAPRCAGQTCRGEPQVTRSRNPGRALVATTARTGPEKTRRSDPWGKPGEEGCAIAGRKVGARAANPLSMEGASGREKPHRVHDGGVEAVLAALAESVNQTRTAKRRAHRYRAGVATEVSEVRSRGRVGGRKRPHHSCAVRRSDAERREALSSPVSMGGTPSSSRPMKNR